MEIIKIGNFEKKFFLNNVDKKIISKEMYNKINKCDTIFALLALLDKSREKDRE